MDNIKNFLAGAAKVAGASALAVLVGSGTLGIANAATEAVANNSVNSAKIVDNSILSVDIANGAVAPADVSAALQPRWAKVATGDGTMGDGTTAILRQRGVTAVDRNYNGEYDVTFARPITNCGWFATLNDDGTGGANDGEITVERASDNDLNTLRIRLYTSAGTQDDPEGDDGFSVMVLC
jgi:hypothetical protein